MINTTRQLHVLDDANDGTFLRVAFATSDRTTVDQHFGSASSFAIYGVNPENFQLFSVVEFGNQQQDGNEDKLQYKFDILEDCIAVYCRACGASAVRQLMAKGIQPVKVHEDARIKEMIKALQIELKQGPSNWLAQAIKRQQKVDDSRFDQMEGESWLD
jgi:nitrogen fixation protein NifX